MRVYDILNAKDVDVTRYRQGDVFITKTQVYMLHAGKLKPIFKNEKTLSEKNIVDIVKRVLKEGKTDA